MKIASWNVNSIRVRQQQVLDWLESEQPDVLGLQELKMPAEKFPAGEFAEAGYEAVVNGQKTYNGVALLSRIEASDAVLDMPGFEDEQRRVIAASYDGIRVINVYVPNGQDVGTEKYEYKLEWLGALTEYVAAQLQIHEKLLIMGDFNIAPDDRDVHDPDKWKDRILCSEPERARLAELTELGLSDAFRLFDQPEGVFSWWDYRAAGFRRNLGLRIDLILVSAALAETCRESVIDKAPRKLERPSDHAPVVAVFD